MPSTPAPTMQAVALLERAMQATQPMQVQAAAAPTLSNELTVADDLLDL